MSHPLIGFFDSGVGGLGVLHEAVRALPDARFLFYADRDHVPYGERTESEIEGYAEEITAFLYERGCDAVVIACNTATSVAAAALRAHYGERLLILGMEPAVKPALAATPEAERVLVVATPVTVREHKLRELLARLDGAHRVDVHALPALVRFAEEARFDDPAIGEYLAGELAPYVSAGIRSVVLGCTHFNYFLPQFAALFGAGARFFDGNAGTVRHLAEVLGLSEAVRREDFDASRVSYFDSGRAVTQERELALFAGFHARLAQIEERNFV